MEIMAPPDAAEAAVHVIDWLPVPTVPFESPPPIARPVPRIVVPAPAPIGPEEALRAADTNHELAATTVVESVRLPVDVPVAKESGCVVVSVPEYESARVSRSADADILATILFDPVAGDLKYQQLIH